jgi:lipopolysaccharide/colanic/teichoic acid biosynthesis glycosyltransferase
MNVLASPVCGLTRFQSLQKRSFDIVVSLLALSLTWWLILVAWVIASLDTRKNGMFTQARVGRNGRVFKLFKIRTMNDRTDIQTTVTTAGDPRITPLGKFFRRTKIDELPQLLNVLLGDMSIVGPRPDVPGFADRLVGADRVILSVRPGITGPATLKYRDEEILLASSQDPEAYNRDVIFPDKVRINREYVQDYSFIRDLVYIWKTVVG